MKIMNLHLVYKNGNIEVIPSIVKAGYIPEDGAKGLIEYFPPVEETGGMTLTQRYLPRILVLTFADGTTRQIPESEISGTHYLSDGELEAGYTFQKSDA